MGMEVPVFGALPSQNLLCISLHLSVPFIIFFNKIVNVTVSLSSASLLSKLAEPVEGVMETSNCSQMEHKLWVTQEPSTCSWHLKWSKISLVGLYPYSIRIELNYSSPSWYHRFAWCRGWGGGGGWNPTHLATSVRKKIISELFHVRSKRDTQERKTQQERIGFF